MDLDVQPRFVGSVDGKKRLDDEASAVVAGRVRIAVALEEAVRGAGYIQKSIQEKVELKRALFQRLDALDDGKRILGGSTSGIPARHSRRDWD